MATELSVKEFVNSLANKLRINKNDIDDYIDDIINDIVDLSDKTKVIEYLAIEAQFRISKHYDFYILAGQILAKHQLERIPQTFSEHVTLLYDNFHEVTDEIKKHIPLIDKRYRDIVIENKEFFDSLIDFTREYDHGYMEYVRNREKFFNKIGNKEIDCIQYELLRIALQIYSDDFVKLKECYHMMVSNKISMTTPTRANSCMENNPLAVVLLQG